MHYVWGMLGLEIARRLLECSTVDRKIPSAVHSATVRFVSTFAYAKQLADADAKTTTAEDLYDGMYGHKGDGRLVVVLRPVSLWIVPDAESNDAIGM